MWLSHYSFQFGHIQSIKASVHFSGLLYRIFFCFLGGIFGLGLDVTALFKDLLFLRGNNSHRRTWLTCSIACIDPSVYYGWSHQAWLWQWTTVVCLPAVFMLWVQSDSRFHWAISGFVIAALCYASKGICVLEKINCYTVKLIYYVFIILCGEIWASVIFATLSRLCFHQFVSWFC